VGVVAVGAYLLMLASSAFAAPGDILAQIEELSPVIDSGTVHAEGSGTDPVVVFSQVVSRSGAPWLRLHFASVTLSGSSTAGSESFIRLTSLDDGAVQSLDSAGLERWENSSAYFNGDGITDCLRERRTV
jgi:hypothetical protein